MDRRPPDENHEWKSIRSELCGMLEAQLDGEDAQAGRSCQCGRGYVRLRAGAAPPEASGGLLRLKHQEKVRRAHLGPFDHRYASHHAQAACGSPCCSSHEGPAAETAASEDAGANGKETTPNGGGPRAGAARRQPLRSL